MCNCFKLNTQSHNHTCSLWSVVLWLLFWPMYFYLMNSHVFWHWPLKILVAITRAYSEAAFQHKLALAVVALAPRPALPLGHGGSTAVVFGLCSAWGTVVVPCLAARPLGVADVLWCTQFPVILWLCSLSVSSMFHHVIIYFSVIESWGGGEGMGRWVGANLILPLHFDCMKRAIYIKF